MQIPPTAELLIWAGFALAVGVLMVPWIYSFIREARIGTRPQDLKTFADMKKAFRKGSRTRDIDRRRPSAIFAMREFAGQGADAAQREEIARLMRDAISAVLHKTDNRTANEVWSMLDTLAAAAPSWEADFVEQVSRSRLEGWVRCRAIERLVSMRGSMSLRTLLQLADDAPVAHGVAAAIGQLGKRAMTPEVLARMERMLDETQNQWAPSAAARALVSLGQATNPILARNLEKFDPWTAFAVRVKTAGIDASSLIERLFIAGVIDDDRRKSIKPSTTKKMQMALNTGDGFKAVTAFLERVRAVHTFDTEWDPVPDYEVLLRQLSRISAPRVTIEDIDVQMDGEACREVNCTVAGQPARFSPQFMGDWTDLEAVLKGLNEGLAAGGHSERFASLWSGDQSACVIVGHDSGLAGLAETLGLPLDVNANAPIAIGVAAEQHLAAQIKTGSSGS